MATYAFPDSLAIQQIAQDYLANLTMNDPVFKILPLRNVDEAFLRWEQKDNYRGLQAVRGINGEPVRIKRQGLKQYLMSPGVYGEFDEIDEVELTNRRALGTFGTPVNITDLTTEAQERLTKRQVDRLKGIAWTALTTGTFAISTENGPVLHTDSFSLQTFTASPGWRTYATATPLADFRSVKLKHRGHSVSFGPDATAYMNSVTLNNLLTNGNQADIYGRRTAGLGTFNNLQSINQLFQGDLLPTIQEYDDGYYDDAGTFNTWIPDNMVVVIGKRLTGESVGEFRFTRNAMNANAAPGPYMIITESERPPKKIRVDAGWNGGIVIWFPSAICIMNC
jgi:hypothetical protein